ncbi:MAG: glycosyltransferase [Lachnospiraceae bacterium]|nr:glycosyltransferase [Lachnospiraceae bacterium]
MNNGKASLCIFTYNQKEYIKDAVYAALQQDYSPLEIIISDDGSTDGTYEIVKDLVKEYNGSHEVICRQNNPNLGIREHINKVLYEVATGEYIFMAAGDDISRFDRVSKCVDIFEKFPHVMSISCLSEEVDAKLNVLNPDELWDGKYTIYNLSDYIYVTSFVMQSGDSRAIRRKVIDSFERLKWTRDEDIFLFIRSILVGSICYLREPIVKRRHHDTNVSANRSDKSLLNGMSKQLYEDLDYAYKRKYINEKEYKKMRVKIGYVMDVFNIYSTSPFKNPYVFMIRCLKKIRLVRFYPPIKLEGNKLPTNLF